MKSPKTRWMAVACGLLFLAASPTQTRACGMNWNEPRSFFENVDFQGHVHVIEKLGELDAGKIKLPIYLIFNSSNRYSSPYSGLLEIPLLASRIEQIDENTFLLRSPSGWLVPFVRNSKVKTILDGSSGMKAELDESRKKITVWSECGDKIMFSRGHITQLQIKDVKLDYIYSGDQVSEIRDASGKAVLKVNFDPQTKEVGGISLGSNSPIVFHWGEMPTGVQQTLTKVVLPDGSEKSFEFGTDAQVRPTLKVNGKQEITWDSTTLLVHKVDDWTYKVDPGKERFANAAIGRTNSKEQTEFWHYDGAKGREIVQGVDGVRRVTTWFTSGKFAGKLRRVTQIRDGAASEDIVTCSYDEQGNLLRYRDEVFDCSIDQTLGILIIRRGHQESIEKTFGKPVFMQRSSDGENLIVFLEAADGKTRQLFVLASDESHYAELIQFHNDIKVN